LAVKKNKSKNYPKKSREKTDFGEQAKKKGGRGFKHKENMKTRERI